MYVCVHLVSSTVFPHMQSAIAFGLQSVCVFVVFCISLYTLCLQRSMYTFLTLLDKQFVYATMLMWKTAFNNLIPQIIYFYIFDPLTGNEYSILGF